MSTISRPVSSYISLDDSHTQHFFTRNRIQKHLRRAGLLNKNGEILTQAEYESIQKDATIIRDNKQKIDDAIVDVLNDMAREHWAYARDHMDDMKKNLMHQFRRIELQYRRRVQPVTIRYTHDGRSLLESNESKQVTERDKSSKSIRFSTSVPASRSQSPDPSEVKHSSELNSIQRELNDIKHKLIQIDQRFKILEIQPKITQPVIPTQSRVQRFARLVESTYNNTNIRSDQQRATTVSSYPTALDRPNQNLIIDTSFSNDPQTFMPYTEFLPTFDMFAKKNWI
ncbi:unnamed protein product [Adineta ricciae]|uniref:Uncharacterized protein n=1 Tax=Adineta ricciae TaxID=249248 RepID=A0A813V391_ADIRI|nr:unnamed protein product [Adineta ricciae]CAF1385852.1 unnamed protein product [Adineta ricciae]